MALMTVRAALWGALHLLTSAVLLALILTPLLFRYLRAALPLDLHL